MISCFLLVPALVPGLVSLLVFLLVFLQTALELNGVLNSCQKRCLFHHDLLSLLVPAGVPVPVSLLLSSFFSPERRSVPP